MSSRIWIVWYTNFDSVVEFHSAWSSEELARERVGRYSKDDQASFSVEPYEVDKDGL